MTIDDLDVLVRSVADDLTPTSHALATLQTVNAQHHTDLHDLAGLLAEAVDLDRLRDRILGEPDWDVYDHLDRHPVIGVSRDQLADYCLGNTVADYAFTLGRIARACGVLTAVAS